MINETTQAQEASLDALLIIWHTWASSESVGQGYPSEAPGTKMYRVSRQYDYENGAIDGEVDSTVASAVDHLVDTLVDPYRTAIRLNAKNLKTGVHVWRSPRLTFDPVERARIVVEARSQLARKLQAAGLL